VLWEAAAPDVAGHERAAPAGQSGERAAEGAGIAFRIRGALDRRVRQAQLRFVAPQPRALADAESAFGTGEARRAHRVIEWRKTSGRNSGVAGSNENPDRVADVAPQDRATPCGSIRWAVVGRKSCSRQGLIWPRQGISATGPSARREHLEQFSSGASIARGAFWPTSRARLGSTGPAEFPSP
jgi:hypothetical protein